MVTNKIRKQAIQIKEDEDFIIKSNKSSLYLGYARQSKKENSEYTIDSQKNAIKEYVEKNNLELEEIYGEEKSGQKGGSRGQFEEMIKKLENDLFRDENKRKYAGLIFFDISRLARNSADFIRIENLLSKGYKIISIRENIIDSAAGLYFFRMIQAEAIYYSERQSSKTSQYTLYRLKDNSYLTTGGKSTTYGYLIKDKKIYIHPIHSKIVKRIFELKSKGTINREIAEIINVEFKTLVNNYNKKIFYNTNKNEEESEDENNENEGLEIDIGFKDFCINKSSEQAYIPNEKTVSNILYGLGTIKYNGRRELDLEIRFEDDIRIFQMYSNKKLVKGHNIIEYPVPDLRIITDEIYNPLSLNIINRLGNDKIYKNKGGALYGKKLKCTCGGFITGQIAGKNYKYRYSCNNARKGKCENKTIIREEDINDFISTKIIKYLNIFKDEEVYWIVYNKYIDGINSELKKEIDNYLAQIGKNKKKRENTINTGISSDNTNIKTVISELDKTILNFEVLINELKEKIKSNEMNGTNVFEYFYKTILNFKNEDSNTKEVILDIILEEIVIGEIISEESRYKNINDRRSDGGYQKDIQEVRLKSPYQFIFNILSLNDKESN